VAATWLTPTAILELAPELEPLVIVGGSPTAAWLEIVELAKTLLTPATWGTSLSQGHWTLTAHLATLQFDASAAMGAVTSRRVDKIQESYAVNTAPGEQDLALTKYGRIHLELRRRLSGVSYFSATSRDRGLPDGRVL